MNKKRSGSVCYGPLVLMACAGVAGAQSQNTSNEQVAQSFGQTGGPTPQLVKQEDGSTRVEWKGGVTADAYVNDISSANGATNTPLTSGTFGKAVVQSDLRGIDQAGGVSQFQLGMTFSNDRSVLSQYGRQINSMQVGRAGPGYQITLGDIAPNFSSLSSALGVRGVFGQRQFGNTSVSGYTGVVAESWEALEGRVFRNQLIRETTGVKVEHALLPSLKFYGTSQVGVDRNDSATAPAVLGTLQPIKIRTSSGGFQYQDGPWQLTGEGATSAFDQNGQVGRTGHAMVLDGSWRGSTVSLRAGHHDIGTGFAALSTAAQAGIKETYAGADWTAAQWMTVGGELRRSQISTLANDTAPSTTTSTDSGTARATMNLGERLPGWTANLQQTESRSFDPVAQASRNGQVSAGVNYASPAWSSGVTYGLAKVRSAGAPASDSDTESLQVMLGRMLSGTPAPNLPPDWTLNVNLSAGLQRQHLLMGTDTANTNYSLGFAGQRAAWGNLNLIFTGGQITQTTGLPSLRQRGLQFEASHPLSKQSAIKLYSRETRRNIGDPLSGATERVTGFQLSYTL